MTTPACDGEWEVFYALIDNPGNMNVRREAAKFCGPCPIRDKCLGEHIARGGEDAAWAGAVHRELARVKTADCEYCGKPMQLKPRAGKRRQYCDDICGHMARAAGRNITLTDIPDHIRKAHAEHHRYWAAGMAVEHIPDDVRAGEKAYQALRHQARKAKAAA